MSRKRKHKHEDHANHEAWVIPYADLLTLLLALFVVLYAMSSVNTTKYRALAQAISAAFNGTHSVINPLTPNAPQSSIPVPTDRPAPIPRTPLAQILLPMLTQHIATPDATPDTGPGKSKGKLSDEQQNLERIRSAVERALQPLIDKKLVILRRAPSWLEIEIRTDILFPSGVATLSPSANQVLISLGDILAPFANPVRVEGYTDDVPIDTAVYPSNWELSAARAASVARLFAEHRVEPERLGIVGWGQYRPAADNTSVDGRNRNRRVLVVVLSDKAPPRRFYTNSDQINQTDAADDGVAEGQAVASPVPAAIGHASAPAATLTPSVTPGATLPVLPTITPVTTLVTSPSVASPSRAVTSGSNG